MVLVSKGSVKNYTKVCWVGIMRELGSIPDYVELAYNIPRS